MNLNPAARPTPNRLGPTLEAVQEGEALENTAASNLTYGSPSPELQPTSERLVLASSSCKLSPIDGDVISAKMTRLMDTVSFL